MPSTSRADRFRPTRRGLVRTTVLGGGALLAGAALTGSVRSPLASGTADRPEPVALAQRELVMWGSSTIASVHHELGVPDTLVTRLDAVVAAMTGIPVRAFGTGGEQSPQIAARRGVPGRRYRLSFDDDVIPATGSVRAVLENPEETEWSPVTSVTGRAEDVLGRLEASRRRRGEYRFARLHDGRAQPVSTGTSGSEFRSTQETSSRASRHLLHVGRNNIGQRETVRADTASCFALAPGDSVVMGMFRLARDAPESRRARDVDAYNEWGRRTYGRLFLDVEDFIRTNYDAPRFAGLLAGSRSGGAKDLHDVREHRIPRSLYSYDGLHLNGWGYLLLGAAIAEKVHELGWSPRAAD